MGHKNNSQGPRDVPRLGHQHGTRQAGAPHSQPHARRPSPRSSGHRHPPPTPGAPGPCSPLLPRRRLVKEPGLGPERPLSTPQACLHTCARAHTRQALSRRRESRGAHPTPCGALRPPHLPGHSPGPSLGVAGDRAPLRVRRPVTRVPSRPDRAWSDSGGGGALGGPPAGLGLCAGLSGRLEGRWAGRRRGGQPGSRARRGRGVTGGQRLLYLHCMTQRSQKQPLARSATFPTARPVRSRPARAGPTAPERVAPSSGPPHICAPRPAPGRVAGSWEHPARREPARWGPRQARAAAAAARSRRVPGQRRSSGGLSYKLAGFTARRWQERELFATVHYSPRRCHTSVPNA